MKKIIYILFALLSVTCIGVSAMEVTGNEAQRLIPGAQQIRISENTSVPEYIKFREGSEIPFNTFERWTNSHFTLPSASGFKLINTSADKLGYIHYRYRQTVNGIPVEGTMYIVHVKNNLITSMNGLLFDKMNASANARIAKPAALNYAISNMNAKTYRWQIPAWEQQIKQVNKDPSATWYPKGELVYAPQNGKYTAENYRLCYKFDIYAQEPLDREYVFVDAVSGQVIYKLNRIHDADATGTAVTAYSGNRTITTDSVSPNSFRLRETARGLGVETYNLEQGTNYINTDFTDTDNFWDNANAQQDEYATDAHWGAEMTYDFYMLKFSRNSIDDSGQKLLSYVHYDVGYVNAFWDGTEMTYGDGGGGYTPLTSLEITGHEISHGVTEHTAGLIYADESGAMNEGFSDCMGNAIRYFGKQPASIDWFIGNEIGGTPFRNMANPNQYDNPDCYDGLYWNAPNEVHNNSGVLNFWFYLLTEGGSGTNDLGNSYNVTDIGIDNAAAILYRTWATYLFPNAEYADARYYSIQAAIDLFGPCTPEVIATTNAWHAVGVGAAFIPGVTSDFSSPLTTYCQLPATVYFTNASNNAGSYVWDFGDGGSSTAANPSHIYTTSGTFDVKLIADGGPCGTDSVIKTAYITISLPSAPVTTDTTICQNTSVNLTASGNDTLMWYDVATGGTPLYAGTTFTTPPLSSNTTYYVESDVYPAQQSAGPPDNTFSAGSIFTFNNYHDLIFDCYAPVKLISVKVYAQGAGDRTITLMDNVSNMLDSVTVNLPDGMSIVTLNFDLPVGTDLELGCEGNVNLFRNQGGAVFPYTLSGVVSITGTNAGVAGYYYYFYDWQLQGPPCISARTPLNVDVIAAPTAAFSSSNISSTYTFTDNSIGATSWFWDFGDGTNTTGQGPVVHTYTADGTYIVMLIVSNGTCQDTTYFTIVVNTVGMGQLEHESLLTVYPNPATDAFIISWNQQEQEQISILLTDHLGRTVFSNAAQIMNPGIHSMKISAAGFASGIYFLQLKGENSNAVKKIIVLN